MEFDPTTMQIPETVPGIRLVLTNGQNLDLPLVNLTTAPVAPTYEELARVFRHEKTMDFPTSRISVSCSSIMLFTLIEMRVTQDEPPASEPQVDGPASVDPEGHY